MKVSITKWLGAKEGKVRDDSQDFWPKQLKGGIFC